jgi:hypothetical protein
MYEVQIAENDTVLPEQIVVEEVALRTGTAVKLSLTTTLTELECDVQPPLVVDTRYEYVPAVSVTVSVVPLPPVVTQLIPPSVERSHAIVPAELATANITLLEPIQTGLAVTNVTVPDTGDAVTDNVVPVDVTGEQAFAVVTRTLTGYDPAIKPLSVYVVGKEAPAPMVVQVTPLSVLICAKANVVAVPV